MVEWGWLWPWSAAGWLWLALPLLLCCKKKTGEAAAGGGGENVDEAPMMGAPQLDEAEQLTDTGKTEATQDVSSRREPQTAATDLTAATATGDRTGPEPATQETSAAARGGTAIPTSLVGPGGAAAEPADKSGWGGQQPVGAKEARGTDSTAAASGCAEGRRRSVVRTSRRSRPPRRPAPPASSPSPRPSAPPTPRAPTPPEPLFPPSLNPTFPKPNSLYSLASMLNWRPTSNSLHQNFIGEHL